MPGELLVEKKHLVPLRSEECHEAWTYGPLDSQTSLCISIIVWLMCNIVFWNVVFMLDLNFSI